MSFNTFTRHLVLALGASTCFTAIAHAQSSAPLQAGSDQPADASASTGQVPPAVSDGDIIVTAQRRSESLQRVPIAITAATAETLKASGVQTTQDIGRISPGVVISPQRNGLTTYLRGVGTQSGTSEQAVAIYVDNIYIAYTGAALFQLNNVDHVEVLKGPQGTLFGRNATGGLVNVITKDPSHTPSLTVGAGYGNYDTYTGNLYATTGLGDRVAVDLAAYGSYQGNGYGRNFFTGNDVNISRSYALRSKLKAEITDTTTAILTGDYAYAKSDYGNARQPVPGRVSTGGFTTVGSIYDANADIPFGLQYGTKAWGLSLKVDQELSSAFHLTSTSAYRNHNFPSLTDTDATPLNLVQGFFREKGETFQQEFLLNGTIGNLQLTGGLFYFFYGRGMKPLQVISGNTAQQSWRSTNVDTNSYSAFAQLTYAVGPRTNLTLGGRYTIEDNEVSGIIRAVNEQGAIIFNTATRTDGVANSYTQKKPTWRLSIDHRLTDDVMVYASWNRGFKTGTYNTFAIGDLPTGPETLDAYEAGFKATALDGALTVNGAAFWYDYKGIQVSTVLTVGTGDRNAAAGRIKGLEGEAVYRFDLGGGAKLNLNGSFTYLDAKYRSYPGALTNVPNVSINGVNTTGAALCARAASGQSIDGTQIGGNTTCSLDASGRQLTRAPKFSYNLGADTAIPLNDRFKLTGNVNWQHTGAFYWDAYNIFRNPAYDVINSQIGFGPIDDSWQVRIWARNLTKERYYINVATAALATTGIPAAPRTYGVAFEYRFR